MSYREIPDELSGKTQWLNVASSSSTECPTIRRTNTLQAFQEIDFTKKCKHVSRICLTDKLICSFVFVFKTMGDFLCERDTVITVQCGALSFPWHHQLKNCRLSYVAGSL